MSTLTLSGSCYWCMEAIFQSLRGVTHVSQGWVESEGVPFVEAVRLTYDPSLIGLTTLVEIHLHTHSSTANHSMRHKYPSAIYYEGSVQQQACEEVLKTLQTQFERPLVTQVLPFKGFKPSPDEMLNYYYNNPQKPFCQAQIQPKLKKLLHDFSAHVDDGQKHVIKQNNVEK